MQDTFNLNNGIGFGEAQILKPYDNSKAEALQLARMQKQEHEKDVRGDSAINRLAKLDKQDIHWKDTELFAQDGEKIKDFVYKNIDKLRSGDAAVQMEYNTMLSDVGSKAAQSKAFKTRSIQVANQIAQADQNKVSLDEDELEVYHQMQDASTAGNWDMDKLLVNKAFNINEAKKLYIDPQYNKLSARKEVNSTIPGSDGLVATTTTSGITPEEYNDMHRRASADPALFKGVSKDFSKQPIEIQEQFTDKDGKLDPIAWWASINTKSDNPGIVSGKKYYRPAVAGGGEVDPTDYKDFYDAPTEHFVTRGGKRERINGYGFTASKLDQGISIPLSTATINGNTGLPLMSVGGQKSLKLGGIENYDFLRSGAKLDNLTKDPELNKILSAAIGGGALTQENEKILLAGGVDITPFVERRPMLVLSGKEDGDQTLYLHPLQGYQGKVSIKTNNLHPEKLMKAAAEFNAKNGGASTAPSGTRAEWINAGWTDAQIDKAVKDKKIIVN